MPTTVVARKYHHERGAKGVKVGFFHIITTALKPETGTVKVIQ